jgi:hypothetical protein
MSESEPTYGERIVRTSFNVTGSDAVSAIKQKSAELINLVAALKTDPRLSALAVTHYETAAMWAVKAATATEAVTAPRT